MRRLKAGALALALLLTLGGLRATDVERERVLRITGNMVCNCGCPPTLVRACSCHRAEEITKEVESLLAAGRTEEEVFQYYEAQFGEKILAAPKPQGFNLLGWVLPFVALAVGGGVVAVVYRRLRAKTTAATEVEGSPEGQQTAQDEKYKKLIRDALSED